MSLSHARGTASKQKLWAVSIPCRSDCSHVGEPTLNLMHTRRLFALGLRALDILATKKAHQLAVRSGDPHGLWFVRLEKIAHVLELCVRPKRREPNSHDLFRRPLASVFDLLRADLTQQHPVLVEHGA